LEAFAYAGNRRYSVHKRAAFHSQGAGAAHQTARWTIQIDEAVTFGLLLTAAV